MDFAFDLAYSLREFEGGERLFVVLLLAADGGDHHSLAVAAQTVLEVGGHEGVSVGNVHALVFIFLIQSENHLLEIGQAEVNIFGFVVDFVIGYGLADPLAASQIHQIELAHVLAFVF